MKRKCPECKGSGEIYDYINKSKYTCLYCEGNGFIGEESPKPEPIEKKKLGIKSIVERLNDGEEPIELTEDVVEDDNPTPKKGKK